MKKITYQITLSDEDYIEFIDRLEKLVMFPAKGDMTFKVEEIKK